MYVSEPTWPNHQPLLKVSGLNLDTYPYYDYAKHRVDFEPMMAKLGTLGQSRLGEQNHAGVRLRFSGDASRFRDQTGYGFDSSSEHRIPEVVGKRKLQTLAPSIRTVATG